MWGDFFFVNDDITVKLFVPFLKFLLLIDNIIFRDNHWIASAAQRRFQCNAIVAHTFNHLNKITNIC